MPQNPVIAGDALARGLRAEFLDTYKQRYTARSELIQKVMRLAVPSNRIDELYFYFESAPHPKRQPRGESVSFDGFQGVSYTVENLAWAKGVDWHRDDRMDDQTGALVDRARMLGTNFALLPERVLFQMLLGTTDLDLLQAVPNAPDGVALFSTTDGTGAARFGATNGNLLTGTGVASSNAVRTDFFTARAQYQLFQDTEGQPLLSPELLTDFTIIYGSANEKVFKEAFIQGRTLDGGAALTNVVLEGGDSLTLWSTPRITDNDWFIAANGVDHMALFEQEREGMIEMMSTEENSDKSRETQEESVSWRARRGYGINLPYPLIQINN